VSIASVAREIGAYLRVRKKWWLLPILVALLLVGGLLVLAQTYPIFSFVYTIF
jgi:hypothetical protein